MKSVKTLGVAIASVGMATAMIPAQAADNFSVKVGGRLQFDAALVDSDDDDNILLENGSGSEFRRLRLFAKGEGFDIFDYKVQISFNEGDEDISVEDAYLRMQAGGGKFLIGQYKQPFSMEDNQSSKYIDFLERSMANQSVAIGRQRAVGYEWNNSNIHWMASLYSQETDNDSGNEAVGFAGRFTIAPVKNDTNVIHFGAAAAVEENNAGFRGVRYRTDYHLMDNRVDNRIDAGMLEGPVRYGLEFAGAWGPVSVKSEYLALRADGEDGFDEDYDVDGFYVNFLYTVGFNTAQSYSTKRGVFERIKASNIWQLGARYDMVNTEYAGDEVDSEAVTIGATYIVNPYVRFKSDLVFAESEFDGADDPFQEDTVLQFRAQVDF